MADSDTTFISRRRDRERLVEATVCKIIPLGIANFLIKIIKEIPFTLQNRILRSRGRDSSSNEVKCIDWK